MVIAHFSKGKSAKYVIGYFAACALLYGALLYHPAGVPLKAYLDSKDPSAFDAAIVGWVFGAILLIRQFVILNQLILRRAEAVWADNGKLFYLNLYWGFFYRAVQCSEVQGFEVTTEGFFASPAIAIQLHSGRERFITTLLLSEPADVIISRLKTACGE